MRLQLSLLTTALALVTGARAACKTEWDCSLNGQCVNGKCVCDPAWHMEDCGMMNFAPAPVCGESEGFEHPCGFRINDVTTWGGSVLKKDDTYYMAAAYMINHCTLHDWTTNSAVVIAESKHPNGPFELNSVAINPWAHNPEMIITPDGHYVIYTLGNGVPDPVHGPPKNCNSPSPDSGAVEMVVKPRVSKPVPHKTNADGTVQMSFTLHYSTSPTGPWTALNTTILNFPPAPASMKNWNPAPYVFSNGTVRIMVHTDSTPWGGEILMQADSFRGPFTVMTGDLTRCTKCEEDPFMYKNKHGWHVLYHRMFDPAGGSPIPSPGWAGGHAFSADGFTWSNISRAYNTSIVLENGNVFEVLRRERPKLIFDSKTGEPTHLSNGAQTSNGTFTIIVPLHTE